MTLLEFLSSLATDTELMAAFRRSPHETLSRLSLTAEDQQALLAGDPVALRKAVFVEQARAARRSREQNHRTEVMLEMIEPPPRDDETGSPVMPEMIDPPPMQEKIGPPDLPEMIGPPPMHEKIGPPAIPEMIEPPPIQEIIGPPDLPEMIEPPPMPEKIEPCEIPEMIEPPPMQEKIGPPQYSSPSPEGESMQVESTDHELEISQDAILAGSGFLREPGLEPGGIWSASGLTVVGMGMRAGVHMTIETRLAIEQATRVLYLVADPVSEACIRKLNPAAESLGNLYVDGKPRVEIYETIIAKILGDLETAGDLCAAFYGHPGVLSYPAWESIRRARATGKLARMLPAISTEDSLFADLGLDIGRMGLQSFEATRFLYYKYNFDPCAGLLLWQISVLGEVQWNLPNAAVRTRLEVLTGYLVKQYGPDHEVFLYHAPELPISRPLIERVALKDLPKAKYVSISTLYIPPRGQPQPNRENIWALERMEVGR